MYESTLHAYIPPTTVAQSRANHELTSQLGPFDVGRILSTVHVAVQWVYMFAVVETCFRSKALWMGVVFAS